MLLLTLDTVTTLVCGSRQRQETIKRRVICRQPFASTELNARITNDESVELPEGHGRSTVDNPA